MSWTHIGCPCGKRAWPSRREAQRTAKKIEGHHMKAYPCPANPAYWHIGHLKGRYLRGTAHTQRHREREHANGR